MATSETPSGRKLSIDALKRLCNALDGLALAVAVVALEILVLLLGVVVVVQARMLLTQGWGFPLGNVAEWVAGVSTFAAFVAAIFAGVAGFRALGRERRRDEAREDAEKAAQASAVAAWPDTQPPYPEEGYTITSESIAHDHRWRVFLRNASDLPVYRVRITWCEGVHALGEQQTIHVLPPDPEPLIQPAPKAVVTEWKTTWGDGGRRPVAPVDRLGVAIDFIDAKGQEWRRDQRGVLTFQRMVDG